MYAITISSIVASAILLLLLLFKLRHLKELLKDEPKDKTVANPPYSLSRTLFFYWTFIIVFSICYIGISTNTMAAISGSVLILMGIVTGTATTAKVIDTNQIQNPDITTVIQDSTSEGFLYDILSDGNGISISRLQTVIFNIIYGASFVGIAVSQCVLYSFSPETLGLLGISSTAYALLKIPENKPAAPQK